MDVENKDGSMIIGVEKEDISIIISYQKLNVNHELLKKLYGYEYTENQKIVLDYMEAKK